MKFYRHEIEMAAILAALIGLGTAAVMGLSMIVGSQEKDCEDVGGILLDTSRGYVCVVVDQIKERK